MSRRIVIGTRGSELALTQTRYVAGRLRALHPEIEVAVEIISSRGDTVQDVPIAKIGGKGVFTKELETGLLEGSIDLAVHSLKDLPTELPEGLCIGAIPPREDPADALIIRKALLREGEAPAEPVQDGNAPAEPVREGEAPAEPDQDGNAPAEPLSPNPFAALPEGACIGTSSLRRQVQLLAHRPDLRIRDIRGNVPTRLRKLEEEGYDAIVLALAGLKRLGLDAAVTHALTPNIMLPAVGQGALAIELRSGDTWLRGLLEGLNDLATERATAAERALLRGLGGGCQTPLGALATLEGPEIRLQAVVCGPGGRTVLRAEQRGPKSDAEALGKAVAEELLARGAADLVQEEGAPLPGAGKKTLDNLRIVVTRAQGQSSSLVEALEQHGATVHPFPTIAIEPCPPDAPLPDAGAVDWLVLTSANGVRCFQAALEAEGRGLEPFRICSICAVGPATAEALRMLGLPVTLTPPEYVAEALMDTLLALEGTLEGKHFLLPRGDKARAFLPGALRAQGAHVTEAIVYNTVPAALPEGAVAAMLAVRPDFVVFTSSSTAANFCAALRPEELESLREHTSFAAIGPITKQTAEENGLYVRIVPAQHDIPGLVQALIAHVSGQVLS